VLVGVPRSGHRHNPSGLLTVVNKSRCCWSICRFAGLRRQGFTRLRCARKARRPNWVFTSRGGQG
jgi:hypothetical protein